MSLTSLGFSGKLLFGSSSSDNSGATTPRAGLSRHRSDSASSSQTIRPPKKDKFGHLDEVQVETSEPSSPPASPGSWATSLHDAIEGLSLAVEQYLSSPEEDSDEESSNISARFNPKKSKQKDGILSRTDPDYRYGDEYQEIRKKTGPICKFKTIPPEARLVPHHLWNTPEAELPPRFKQTRKNTN